MTEEALTRAAIGSVEQDAPPPGTAIARPLRHVHAVRERHLQQLAERSPGPASRSARAWGWALGETDIAPVTDRVTAVPPRRSDIEAEITAADERRLRGNREKRADSAATILRWLIGEDDHVPVRGPNPGELVGGFGDVVRSPDQIAEMVTALTALLNEADGQDLQVSLISGAGKAQFDEADYLDGVAATLRWVTHKEAAAPISGTPTCEVTGRDLKVERVHAEDVIEQAAYQGTGDLLPRMYGLGVLSTINWLLGDSITLQTAAITAPSTEPPIHGRTDCPRPRPPSSSRSSRNGTTL